MPGTVPEPGARAGGSSPGSPSAPPRPRVEPPAAAGREGGTGGVPSFKSCCYSGIICVASCARALQLGLGGCRLPLSPGTLDPSGAWGSADGSGGRRRRPSFPGAKPLGQMLRPPVVARYLGPLTYFEHRCAAGVRGRGRRWGRGQGWGWGQGMPISSQAVRGCLVPAQGHPQPGTSGVQPPMSPPPAPNERSAPTDCLGPPRGAG